MRTLPPCLRATPDGLEVDVLVQPRASRSRPVGLHDGRWKLQLAAPPVDNEANEALVELVASLLGANRRDVRIVRGATGRRKTVSVKSIPVQTAADIVAGTGP